MSPVSVGTSRSIHALETGEAKLWSLLVGVNQYWDENLPSLRYSAFDCQGLGEALVEATQGFPRKEVIIYHDFATVAPKSETVRTSLKQIVAAAKPQDTILIYFSGHGVLDINTQQVFLCLTDTSKDDLPGTGLSLPELLQLLGTSAVHRQMIWLDACHSGEMTLRGAKGELSKDRPVLNPTRQLVEVLRQRAAQSKGFYALLSCDQNQRSWEFPELEHGLFTYYLMRGLRGEAADVQDVIEADGLYKYVYHQTLQYIEHTNQKLRLLNQQKRSRGETDLHTEYPLQTPKRIVEGVGELVLGLKPESNTLIGSTFVPPRRALFIDGLSSSKTALELSKLLRQTGGFELEYWPQTGKLWSEVRMAVRTCLRWPVHSVVSGDLEQLTSTKELATVLLYLRGKIEEIEDGEAWLVLGDSVRLSRSWLQQELRRAAGKVQQIIILDCPGANSLSDWVEELKLGCGQGQCIIAAAAIAQQPDQFTQALLETLVATNQQVGLPVAEWISKLQVKLERIRLPLHVWLSGLDGVIEALPNGSWFSSHLHTSRASAKFNSVIKVLPGSNKLNVQPEQKPEPSEPKIPVAVPVESSQPTGYFQEDYLQLEVMLKELIGPIASTLLRQVAAQASSPQSWVEDLMQHLPPLQQIELEKQSTALFSKSAVQPQTKSSIHAPSLKHEAIPEAFVRECERTLANFIGPIANFLVQKTLKSHPQIPPGELVEILATEISDSQKAREFRQRLRHLS